MKANHRILILDYTLESRLLLKIRLEMDGFEVFDSDTFTPAPDYILQNHFDIVIFDCLEAGNGDFSWIEKLKSHPRARWVSLIALSAIPFDSEALHAMKTLGVDAALIKPYEYERLFAILRKIDREKSAHQEDPLDDPDRRRASRFETFHFARVKEGVREYSVRVRNMSQSGVNVLMPRETPVGSFLEITFHGTDRDFKRFARVIWSEREPGYPKVATGLEIHSFLL